MSSTTSSGLLYGFVLPHTSRDPSRQARDRDRRSHNKGHIALTCSVSSRHEWICGRQATERLYWLASTRDIAKSTMLRDSTTRLTTTLARSGLVRLSEWTVRSTTPRASSFFVKRPSNSKLRFSFDGAKDRT